MLGVKQKWQSVRLILGVAAISGWILAGCGLTGSAVSAVQDADISALQQKVKELESRLSAVEGTNVKSLWMYDGNGVKRHRFVQWDLHIDYSRARVEVEGLGDLAYEVNTPAPNYSTDGLVHPAYGGSIVFANPECSGDAYVDAYHFGILRISGKYVWSVSQSTPLYDVKFQSYKNYQVENLSKGVCVNSVDSISRKYAKLSDVLISEDGESYSYPAPLTIGQ